MGTARQAAARTRQAQPMAAHRAIDHEGEAAREVERACQEPVPRLEDDG
eukprot:COSAG06_NODE_27265_length_596_cov_2.142446_1_plen_48_part_10